MSGLLQREERTALVARDWRLLVGGQLVPAEGGATLDVYNPATGQVVARAPDASPADVNAAVAAAFEAFRSWRRVPIAERAARVNALADLIDAHGDELAWIDTIDNGSPIKVMRGDYKMAVEQLRFFAGLAPALRGESIPTPDRVSIDFTTREPFGVVGRIVPFNHPFMFAASKLAAPLVAGNTIILKPSQHTSLSALRLGELCAEVFPPGVVNVLSGKGSVAGERLVVHPDVPRLALTGSVEVGLHIQRSAATERVKVITLELGGKNPIIVFPDADQDDALAGAIRGMNFTWQGQSCGSTSRLYVHRSIWDGFLERLTAKLEAMKVGDPSDESTDVGAIVSRQQFESVSRHLDAGKADPRATLLTGGVAEVPGDGWYIRPTLFALEQGDEGVTIAEEEIFGPILVAAPFDSYDEVIERANRLPLGLTASVWTKSLETALSATRDLETGYAWVNWSSSHVPGTPFGGVKDSGVGREEGIDELFSYTQSKNVYVRFGRAG
jgi:acyl-CoA reductase-like NAD-dependent aldehyde dehydrogenase